MRPWVLSHIETLQPYVPGKPIAETQREFGLRDVVKLASNENPLGPSPLAKAAMAEALGTLHLYPDASSHDLSRKLAVRLGVRPEQIVLGSGSNEVIELLIRTFMVPERDEALVVRGSFVMYKVSLQAHGRNFVEVPMKAGFQYDLDALAARLGPKTRMVFLANPDNPTGTAFPKSAFSAFMAKVPKACLVVLDEAYFEYAQGGELPDGIAELSRYPNLAVLRTFSKAYGLAGLRVGYGVMQAELAGYLHRCRMPFNVSTLAQVAALAALDDSAHVEKTRMLTRQGISEVTRALRGFGAQVPDSFANFVFADFGQPAQPLFEALLRKGVITRPVANYGFPNALRISVGLEAENLRLLAALKEVL
ncbi:MAG: histidinol-phosphate transaminase [Myxococcaceae bacterium]